MKKVLSLLIGLLILTSINFSKVVFSAELYEVESNNDFSTANIVALGDTIQGQVLASNDYDFFKLQILYPQETKILLSNIPSGCNFDLYIYDSNGSIKASSTNGSNTDDSIIQTLNSGTYYIKVIRYSGSSSSFYKLSTLAIGATPITPSPDGFVYENEANDDFSTANAIPFGSTVKGSIPTLSNVDYFKLQLSSNDNINILLTNISTGCDYDLVLYDFNNNYIASSKKGSNVDESITHSLAAGIYYIEILSYSGISNNYYSLSTTSAGNAPIAPYPDGGLYEREPNDSSSTAYPIAVGNSIKGQITSTSDNDFFKFQTYSTENVKIGLSDVPSDCNFDLYLYDSNMNRIDYSTRGFGMVESIYKSVPAGTYYIKVISLMGTSTEYYNLSMADVIPPTSVFHGGDIYEFDDSFSLATDMGEGSFTVSEANLNVSNDMDYFKFNLIQRSSVRIVLTNPNYSTAKYRFDLYNSSYGDISYAYNVSDYVITLDPGTYYIKAHNNMASPYTGLSYQLQMTATGL